MNAQTSRFDPTLLISQVNTKIHKIRWMFTSEYEEDVDWHVHHNADQAGSVKRVINLLSGTMEILSMSEVLTRFNIEIEKYLKDPGVELDLFSSDSYISPLDGIFLILLMIILK